MAAANEDSRLAAAEIRKELGCHATPDAPCDESTHKPLTSLCHRLESGESIILPTAEVDALRAEAAEWKENARVAAADYFSMKERSDALLADADRLARALQLPDGAIVDGHGRVWLVNEALAKHREVAK